MVLKRTVGFNSTFLTVCSDHLLENFYFYKRRIICLFITRWSMAPAEVNAYYSASLNQMVFPSGILQPPFFDNNVPMWVLRLLLAQRKTLRCYVTGVNLLWAFENDGYTWAQQASKETALVEAGNSPHTASVFHELARNFGLYVGYS